MRTTYLKSGHGRPIVLPTQQEITMQVGYKFDAYGTTWTVLAVGATHAVVRNAAGQDKRVKLAFVQGFGA